MKTTRWQHADDDNEDADLDKYASMKASHKDSYTRYSDDEDTSYKIRRSATKLLAALIGTRPEMLSTIYRDVSPVLILRFGDREETVKLEVWSTYGLLLSQTAVYGGLSQSKEDVTRRKCKHDTE
ncbi:uncharacterized protein C8R40DRAFT_1196269, partial [Lentinula edodes]|uniref:uncharacterized protein n=1 Tax=Lentinula edodes TaxID=5353 RepID=UPI001E8D5D5F